MLASFVLDPGRRSHALDELARERLSLALGTYAELVGRGRAERPFAAVPLADAARYCAADSEIVLRLHDAFRPELEDHQLVRLLETIEMPLMPVLVDMESRGVCIDLTRLGEISRAFAGELASLERAIYHAAGTDFNINSTPQLRHVLFEKHQLPILKKTKTGPSTDYEVLEQLAAMGHEVPRLLIEYRELSKLKSTYVDALPGFIHPQTGRIHTSFNQTGAATGRLSSSDPNLQNIPVRTPRGEAIRRAFVAPPGAMLLTADYSHRAAPPGPSLTRPGVRRSLRAGRGHSSPDGGDHLRRGAGPGHRGHASPRQDDQLRHDLRAGGVRSRPTARHHPG